MIVCLICCKFGLSIWLTHTVYLLKKPWESKKNFNELITYNGTWFYA